MMLLLDQGLPRSTVLHLRESGIEAVHVGDIGLATADDPTILQRAREQDQIVVTLDADFHMQLALAGATKPSVIRIRIEGLRAKELADLLVWVLGECRGDLTGGALVTVTESALRFRRLPLLR
jgi:predicted nuclease of predicted toxin-antitoxin system